MKFGQKMFRNKDSVVEVHYCLLVKSTDTTGAQTIGESSDQATCGVGLELVGFAQRLWLEWTAKVSVVSTEDGSAACLEWAGIGWRIATAGVVADHASNVAVVARAFMETALRMATFVKADRALVEAVRAYFGVSAVARYRAAIASYAVKVPRTAAVGASDKAVAASGKAAITALEDKFVTSS
jgi:hypothetical protein